MLKKMPRLLRGLSGMPEPLDPPPEECFRRALELAPNLLEAHTKRLEFLRRHDKTAEAIKAGEQLLALFPDHVEALEQVADLYQRKERPDRAVELLDRALRHNPLDRDLRQRMLTAQMTRARQLAEESKFDQARPHYQAALTYAEANDVCTICCRWAAAEMKAGDTARADELLAQARTRSPGELLITYVLLVESNRLSLGSAIKTRYTRAFNKEIATTGTPDVAVALVGWIHSLELGGVEYYGQKSHTKNIWDYADRIDKNSFSEVQLKKLLASMAALEAPTRMMGRFIDHARRHFPKNPFFPYYEAVHRMGDDPEDTGPSWQITPLLDLAERLAQGLPTDPELKGMLDDIQRRRQLLALLNPFMALGGLGGFPFFGGDDDDFFDPFGDDDDDDDDDDSW
jgi:tetratricopeptide (TPR) repeat protein